PSERSGRGWPLPARHSPNKAALRPLRAPVPAPPRTGRPDPPDANPIRDNPSSHPAGTYNPLRPRPAPFCCLENNNSAGSAVRLSPRTWEKNQKKLPLRLGNAEKEPGCTANRVCCYQISGVGIGGIAAAGLFLVAFLAFFFAVLRAGLPAELPAVFRVAFLAAFLAGRLAVFCADFLVAVLAVAFLADLFLATFFLAASLATFLATFFLATLRVAFFATFF